MVFGGFSCFDVTFCCAFSVSPQNTRKHAKIGKQGLQTVITFLPFCFCECRYSSHRENTLFIITHIILFFMGLSFSIQDPTAPLPFPGPVISLYPVFTGNNLHFFPSRKLEICHFLYILNEIHKIIQILIFVVDFCAFFVIILL